MTCKERLMQVAATLVGIVIFAVIAYFGFQLVRKIYAKPWMGIYYDDPAATTSTVTGTFKTYEECRDWAREQADGSPVGTWRYTCGYKCQFVRDVLAGDTYECEEIRP
ncbi:MAG: hypothetical protein ACK2TX_08625 [Anaerolineales bacterium]